MHLWIISSFLLGCTIAAPQGYGAPAVSVGGGFGGFGDIGGGGYGGGGGQTCGEGEGLDINGNCVRAIVSRNVFSFNAPRQSFNPGPPPQLPPPKVDYNIVFVRTPETPEGQEPIVIPPPQQKTLVYVLNKNGEIGGQQVIEVPAGPNQKPEVYYVNYDEGDNPQLPGGITLQEALSNAGQLGQVIGGGGGFGGGGGGGGYSAPPPSSGGGHY